MASSIFGDKSKKPTEKDLAQKLPGTKAVWKGINDHISRNYPQVTEEWKHYGKKYGWSFQIKSKKRTVLYLIPCEGYFRATFVYGNKATKAALKSDLPEEIKSLIQSAKVYVEGRGFSIDVNGIDALEDIKTLISIKMSN